MRAAVPMTFDAAGKNKRWEYQGVFAITETWSATFGAESERSRMRTRLAVGRQSERGVPDRQDQR